MHTPLNAMIRCAVALTALFGTTGCGENDFEEFYEIAKLRTIAISPSLPGVGPGETVVFEAVTVHPEPATVLSYDWEVCLLTDGPDANYACTEGGIPLGDGDDNELPNTFATGSGRTFEFTQDFVDGDELVGLCTALAQQAEEITLPDFVSLPGCSVGLPIYVRLSVCEGSSATCPDPEVAFMSYFLLLEEAMQRNDRNTNPMFSGLLVDGAVVRADGSSTFRVNPDGELRLSVPVDANVAETYTRVEGFDPTTMMMELGEDRDEELRASWFTTAGQLGRFGYFDGDRAPLEELQTNVLTFPEDEYSGVIPLRFWIVLRDDRRGNFWREYAFSVDTNRPSDPSE